MLISVSDDGHGFPVSNAQTENRTGRGIANMQRRAEAVGGSLAIDSGDGGTTVTLAIPLR